MLVSNLGHGMRPAVTKGLPLPRHGPLLDLSAWGTVVSGVIAHFQAALEGPSRGPLILSF